MNKRIRELLKQAEERYPRHLAVAVPEVVVRQDALEKFAELIVRECVQTLIDNTPVRYTNEAAEEDWDKGYDRAMKDCVHHIQEHFGVE